MRSKHNFLTLIGGRFQKSVTKAELGISGEPRPSGLGKDLWEICKLAGLPGGVWHHSFNLI